MHGQQFLWSASRHNILWYRLMMMKQGIWFIYHYKFKTIEITVQTAFLNKMKNIFNAFYSHKSVLKYFKPESQINTTAVLPLKEDLSSAAAAATLAPDQKPAKIPSSPARMAAPSGSAIKHYMAGLYSLKAAAQPAKDPPVTAKSQNASIYPPDCRMISGPVLR